MEKTSRKKILGWIVRIGLVGVIGVFFYFILLVDSGFSPYYGDEYFYFQNSRGFVENSTLLASFTYSGAGSRLVGTDAHGPAYPLLYGFVSKLIGWHKFTIPLLNSTIFLLAVSALCLSERNQKPMVYPQLIFVLGSPITLFYSFTFMPELIHLAGGIILYLSCRQYLASLSTRDYLLLVTSILILGLIRSTWFFGLIGLMILPGPLRGYEKLLYIASPLLLAYLHQHFFHEQVSNAFTDVLGLATPGSFDSAIERLAFNLKRNVYFSLYYSEGWFYTIQKVIFGMLLLFAILFFRKNRLVRFGVIVSMVLLGFNLILYKNYGWVEMRMLTPMTFFLMLSMLQAEDYQKPVYSILFLNSFSFLLVFPTVEELISIRNDPQTTPVPTELEAELKNLSFPLIYIDPALLDKLALYELPVQNIQGEPIRYILPYYPLNGEAPTHQLISTVTGQFRACPKNIRCQ